jgi:hypothetical protein
MSTFNNRFTPRLEGLDDRALMSCSVGAVGGHVIVTGDAANDQVTIRDNGHGGVTVVATGAGVKSFTGINKITVNTEGGHDQVTYTLWGSLVGKQYVNVGLGSPYGVGAGGNDTFRATLANGIDLLPGSRLDLFVDGGGAKDNLNVIALGVDVRAGAVLKTQMTGGNGVDNITQRYNGELDGSLAMRTFAGAANDTVWQSMNCKPGSTGIIAGWVDGQDGNDSLSLFMYLQPAVTVTKADLIGGNGVDGFMYTPNINVVQ